MDHNLKLTTTTNNGVSSAAPRAAVKAVGAVSKSWTMCLKRVFEVNPILCRRCGIEMEPVAAIVSDRELERLLANLGLPAGLPRTKPARGPPLLFHGENSQIDPSAEAWHGIDEDLMFEA